MKRRLKVELYNQIKLAHSKGGLSIRELARRFQVHRRDVRLAISGQIPSVNKPHQLDRSNVIKIKDFIYSILELDKSSPRKQRHTAHRIFIRIQQELPECKIAERTVRRYVNLAKRQLGLLSKEIYIPQVYQSAQEAQVDWYEAYVDFPEVRRKVYCFSMRSMFSGAAFHMAYPHATQQAFFDAHQEAFIYFGGVFHTLRYDNLTSAVKKILVGHEREEQEKFKAFHEHWGYSAEFCNPSRGNEKGGVEGEAGYFRRNHLVPIPKVSDMQKLNQYLLEECYKDQGRMITGKEQSVREGMEIESGDLLPLAKEGYQIAELYFPAVDNKGCVKVCKSFYSTPLKVYTKVEARVLPIYVEIWYERELVARHERSYQSGEYVLELEHYLPILERKPGAFEGSIPLKQWKDKGKWTTNLDKLSKMLEQRVGKQEGARQLITILILGREHGYEQMDRAIRKAIELGSSDVEVIKYLMRAEMLDKPRVEPLCVESLARYDRAKPEVAGYDQLLGKEVVQ
jgi:transposase